MKPTDVSKLDSARMQLKLALKNYQHALEQKEVSKKDVEDAVSAARSAIKIMVQAPEVAVLDKTELQEMLRGVEHSVKQLEAYWGT